MKNCGCKIVKYRPWKSDLNGGKRIKMDHIDYCPLHSAAEEMLTDLKVWHSTYCGCEGTKPCMTRDLIARAEGQLSDGEKS